MDLLKKKPIPPPACEAKKQQKKRSAEPALLLKRITQTDLGQVAQSWQDLSVEPRTAGREKRPLRGAGRGQRAPRVCATEQKRRGDGRLCQASWDQQQAGFDRQRRRVSQAPTQRVEQRVMLSTLFCETAPRNPELNGVVYGQLAGVNLGLFGSTNTATIAFGARECILLLVSWGRVADHFSFLFST